MSFELAYSLTIWLLLYTKLDYVHSLPMGANDTDPLEIISKLAKDVSALQAELQAVETFLGKTAAFHSRLDSQTPPPNTAIHMTPVHEVGNGYNVTNGMYVAPFSGWYYVGFQLFPKERPASYFNLDLYKNGTVIVRASCDDVDTRVTCHSGVTLHVSAGEKLWIQSNFGGNFYTAPYDNFFSVVLVRPDQ